MLVRSLHNQDGNTGNMTEQCVNSLVGLSLWQAHSSYSRALAPQRLCSYPSWVAVLLPGECVHHGDNCTVDTD